jgi:hypothetical protein
MSDYYQKIRTIRQHIQVTKDIIRLNWQANHWSNVIQDLEEVVDLIEDICNDTRLGRHEG